MNTAIFKSAKKIYPRIDKEQPPSENICEIIYILTCLDMYINEYRIFL